MERLTHTTENFVIVIYRRAKHFIAATANTQHPAQAVGQKQKATTTFWDVTLTPESNGESVSLWLSTNNSSIPQQTSYY
jgi:hypothetical protein